MQKETPLKCPICLKQYLDKFRIIRDYKSNDGAFSLYECLVCGVQFWAPFESPSSKWYQERYNFDVNSYTPTKRDSFFKFIKRHKNLSNKKIFDIGCGTGDFLSLVKARGAETYGVDFNKDVIDFAVTTKSLDNLELISSIKDLNNHKTLQYDFITMFEVIEHLDNPLDTLHAVKGLLKDDGVFILSAPNRSRWFVNNDVFDRPPNHLSRWDKKSMVYLLNSAGYRVIKIGEVNDRDLFFSTLRSFLKSDKESINLINDEGRQGKKSALLTIIKKCIRYFIDFVSKFKSLIGVGNTLYIEVVKK